MMCNKDKKEKAKEYVRLMKQLWDDLNKAITLEGIYRKLGRGCFEDYKNARICLIECYPNQKWDEFDLPFLKNKPTQELSKAELSEWKLHVSWVRGHLVNFIKGRK